MANRYWVGGNLPWDNNVGLRWSTTSGGAAGASIPGSGDRAIFDANSGAAAVSITTTDKTVQAVVCTGFTGSLTLSGRVINFNTNEGFVTDSGMTFSATGAAQLNFAHTSGTFNFNAAGLSMAGTIITISGAGGTTVLQNHLSCTRLRISAGTFDANDFNVQASGTGTGTTAAFNFDGTTAREVIFGNGTWELTASGSSDRQMVLAATSNLTLTPEGSTILFSGSGSGGKVLSYGTLATGSLGVLRLTGGSGNLTNGGGGSAKVRRIETTAGFTGVVSATSSRPIEVSEGCEIVGGSGLGSVTFTATSGLHDIDIRIGGQAGHTVLFNGVGGSWRLINDLNLGAITPVQILAGDFDSNGYDITTNQFLSTGTDARSVALQNSLLTISSNLAASNVFTLSGSNLTWNAGTSEIRIAGNATRSQIFAGGGYTFNKLRATLHGSQPIVVTGDNTFADLEIVRPAANATIQFGDGSTQTIGAMSAVLNGANLVLIRSQTGAVQHNLVKSGSGVVGLDYLDIQDSVASPGSTWYAGDNSTDSGNNSGWLFQASPADILESLEIGDSAGAGLLLSDSISEDLESEDSVSASVIYLGEAAEAVVSSDSSSAQQVSGVELEEELDADEIAVGFRALDAPLSEADLADDVLASSVEFAAHLDESEAVLDEQQVLRLVPAGAEETAQISEAVELGPTQWSGPIAEAAQAADAPASTLRSPVLVAESAVASEALVSQYSARGQLRESVSVAEAMAAGLSSHVILLERNRVAEDVVATYDVLVALPEQVLPLDVVNKTAMLSAPMLEALEVLDQQTGEKHFFVGIQESTVSAEEVSFIFGAAGRLQEALPPKEGLAANVDFQVLLQELALSADFLAAVITTTGVGTLKITEREVSAVLLGQRASQVAVADRERDSALLQQKISKVAVSDRELGTIIISLRKVNL